ncbi:MAG: FliI/YscN family ATPase [Deltaproteobacteria bacterium]|nr:FliI/YscN family ATPase [Deltaproteobacteria bacterium]
MQLSESFNLTDELKEAMSLKVRGKISAVTGSVLRVKGINAVVGQQVELWPQKDTPPVKAEVIGMDKEELLLMALESIVGIGPGCEVSVGRQDPYVPVGDHLLGRVIDGMGRPIDGKPMPLLPEKHPLRAHPPDPMKRQLISEPFSSGVRIVDSMLTVGKGQRIGIFAGAGVGKSTMLSMITRNAEADVIVIGLIGERGREVREFVEEAIAKENRARTVVVAVTGDEAPLLRVRGALLSTAVAEYFRGQGKNVILLFDSLTRYAMALREVGLSVGELPATKGYPPSVFIELSRIVERAGTDDKGSITALYTVLVEGDDLSDPVADSSRSLLDGHIVLNRQIADRGLFPAVDVLASVSRVMPRVVSSEHLKAAREAGSILASYKQSEDLIKIGAYQSGSDKNIDDAVKFVPFFEKFLAQDPFAKESYESSSKALFDMLDNFRQTASAKGK